MSAKTDAGTISVSFNCPSVRFNLLNRKCALSVRTGWSKSILNSRSPGLIGGKACQKYSGTSIFTLIKMELNDPFKFLQILLKFTEKPGNRASTVLIY